MSCNRIRSSLQAATREGPKQGRIEVLMHVARSPNPFRARVDSTPPTPSSRRERYPTPLLHTLYGYAPCSGESLQHGILGVRNVWQVEASKAVLGGAECKRELVWHDGIAVRLPFLALCFGRRQRHAREDPQIGAVAKVLQGNEQQTDGTARVKERTRSTQRMSKASLSSSVGGGRTLFFFGCTCQFVNCGFAGPSRERWSVMTLGASPLNSIRTCLTSCSIPKSITRSTSLSLAGVCQYVVGLPSRACCGGCASSPTHAACACIVS